MNGITCTQDGFTAPDLWDAIQRYLNDILKTRPGRDVGFVDVRACIPMGMAIVTATFTDRTYNGVSSGENAAETRRMIFRPASITLDSEMIRQMRRHGFTYSEIADITELTPLRVRKIEAANADPSKARVI